MDFKKAENYLNKELGFVKNTLISYDEVVKAMAKYAESEQLTIPDASQAKRTVCTDCGDYGWIYSEDGTSRKTCPCHY